MSDLIQIPSLDEIAADTTLAADLSPAVETALLARCARVQTALVEHQLARLIGGNGNGSGPSHIDAGDVLLDVNQASAKTGLSKAALYKRKDLPFRVQVGPATLRFSSKAIERWILAKRVRPTF